MLMTKGIILGSCRCCRVYRGSSLFWRMTLIIRLHQVVLADIQGADTGLLESLRIRGDLSRLQPDVEVLPIIQRLRKQLQLSF